MGMGKKGVHSPTPWAPLKQLHPTPTPLPPPPSTHLREHWLPSHSPHVGELHTHGSVRARGQFVTRLEAQHVRVARHAGRTARGLNACPVGRRGAGGGGERLAVVKGRGEMDMVG